VGSLLPVSAMEPRRLLFGHYNGSVSIFSDTLEHDQIQLHNQAITAIHVRNPIAYIATLDGFLFLYHLDSRICMKSIHVSTRKILAIQTTEGNTIIVFTLGTVMSFDPNLKKITEIMIPIAGSITAHMNSTGLVGISDGRIFQLQCNSNHEIVLFKEIMTIASDVVGICDRYVVTLRDRLVNVISLHGKQVFSMKIQDRKVLAVFGEGKLFLLTEDSLLMLDI
jgi:hypothetical protein